MGHPLRSRPILLITDTITKNKYPKKRALERDRYSVSDENNSTVCFTSDVRFWHQKTELGSIKLIELHISG